MHIAGRRAAAAVLLGLLGAISHATAQVPSWYGCPTIANITSGTVSPAAVAGFGELFNKFT